jgi:hypothetical protein
MRKSAILLASVFAAIASGACAGDNDGAPILFRAPGMAVIMKGSLRHIDVVTGDNQLDKLRTFECRSAGGCVVIMSASVNRSGTIGSVTCSLVDGVSGAPGCPFDSNDAALVVTRSQIVVGQGSHTVQTIFHSDNSVGQVLGWSVDYTVYERRAP